MKVVINACFGGFSLSPKAALRMHELGEAGMATPVDEYWGDREDDGGILSKSKQLADWRAYLDGTNDSDFFLTVFSPDEKFVISTRPDNRNSPILIQVIEEMGAAANGRCADLRIVEVPDDVDYKIDEYDGREHVAEKHRTWY